MSLGYLAVFERNETGYVAYLPDVPGCVAGALTLERTEELIQEALYLHLHTLKENGIKMNRPTCFCKKIYIPEEPANP